MEETLRTVGSFEQFVLLSVVELSVAGETPAHSYDVTRTARDHLGDVDRDPFGGIERQEIIAALGSLADEGLLSKATTESPTGKGRPAYELAVDADATLAELDGDDAVGTYVETLREAA